MQLKCSRLAHPVLFRKAHSLPQLDKLSVCTELPQTLLPLGLQKCSASECWQGMLTPSGNKTPWLEPRKSRDAIYGVQEAGPELTALLTCPHIQCLESGTTNLPGRGKTFWRGLDQCSATSQHALRHAETHRAAQSLKTT